MGQDKPQPTSWEERQIERHKDDPAHEFRASINGNELFKDEHFDRAPFVFTKPKRTSALFEQLIADTRQHLINLGEIKK